MKKQKTKLGARILSESELNAILPNADSVYEQIIVFRNSISEEQGKLSDGQHEIEQKTNNIGIMGCRGAGKTSVLKTYYHKLRSQNEKKDKRSRDIILPLIVPENMSSGTTLMDAVLGRLKSVVEDRKEGGRTKYQGDCIYTGRASLEQQYDELVKQYCYIKKDYRDILIQQFTTEQNYVDKTKKVFSSDSEFINLFHQFVKRLLQNGRETDEEKTEENPMIFLFIDDVDLSTNRCMDIVRTLLVYLSNPRIVTFISGDMETFEEELTLEFLRQEGALRKDVFRETYYTVNDAEGKSSLLERKKLLAYEYLKKIIPPAYRRTIRYWSLEDRGNYRVTAEDGSPQKSLTELLMEVTEESMEKLYFVYNEGEERKCMGLAFHMFDDTSRGLNNVYNVLQEICDIKAEEKEKAEENEKAERKKPAEEEGAAERAEMLLLWRLIETMVDSKPLYAKYKSELLKQIIVLEQERVKIDFDNGYQLLYGEAADQQAENDNEEKRAEQFSSQERFAICYLIDFATSLFYPEQFGGEENKKYYILKDRIIQEYLSDATIDGKIASKRELLGCLVDGQGDEKVPKDSVQSILSGIMTRNEFILNLQLIRFLGRDKIYDILTADKRKLPDRENVYQIAYAFSRAVQSIYDSEEKIQKYLTEFYLNHSDIMLRLLDKLSLNPWMIYGRQLTNDVSDIVDGMQYVNVVDKADLAEANFWNVENYITESRGNNNQNSNLLWAEYNNRNLVYWIYYEKVLREKREKSVPFDIKSKAEEAVLAGVTKTVLNQIKDLNIMDEYKVRELKEVSYESILVGKEEKEKKEIQVIGQLDERGLWGSAYAKEKVFIYLNSKRMGYVSNMIRGRIIFDATQLISGAYGELVSCYKGSSGQALAYKLLRKVNTILFLTMYGGGKKMGKFSDGKYYLRLEQSLIIQCLLEEFLTIHRMARYGKKETRKLLMEMKELPLIVQPSAREAVDKELQEREKRIFAENLHILKDKEIIELETNETWQTTIKDICDSYYAKSNNRTMETWIKEHFAGIAIDNFRYIKYLVQKKQIERMKKEFSERENDHPKLSWSSTEPAMEEKEYLFFFHSYLRYQQANDSEAQMAGARAEDIAKLAEYMLDSEIKADEEIQNEVYQIISEELELTEEEFETLF